MTVRRPHSGRRRRPGGRRRPIAAMLAATIAAAGACSIPTDSSPRDVPADDQRDITPSAQAPGATTGETRIFLVAENDEGRSVLRSVARDVEDTPAVVRESLLQGSNDEEQERGVHTVLPDDLEIGIVPSFPQDALVLELNTSLSELPGETRMLAVGQIVATFTALDGVRSVELRLDPAPAEDDAVQWPTDDGELVDRPLTVYDFIGLLDTAQPAHPPLPSQESPTTVTAQPSDIAGLGG